MTNTTLREDFTKKFFSLETDKNPYTGKYESNFFVKKEKTLAEFLDFIESKVKEARQEMKKECLAVVPEISQSVIDTYDEYTRYGSRVIGDMERQNEIRTAINYLK